MGPPQARAAADNLSGFAVVQILLPPAHLRVLGCPHVRPRELLNAKDRRFSVHFADQTSNVSCPVPFIIRERHGIPIYRSST